MPDAKPKLFHTLTLGGGPLVKGLEVFLDGMPLKGVTSLNIVASHHDVIKVTLELIVDMNPSQLKGEAVLEVPLNIEELPEHIQQIASDLTALMESQQKEVT